MQSINVVQQTHRPPTITTLFLYTQNISGGATKLLTINNSLANSRYDVVCFQETWFGKTTDIAQLTSNVDFDAHKSDRRTFQYKRTEKGGGLVILYRRKLNAQHVAFPPTSLEIQAIAFMSHVIINVYLPPTSKALKHETRFKMIDELAACIDFVRNKYVNHNILIVGDFNLPNISWIEEDDSEALRPTAMSPLNRTEQYFLNKLGDLAIFQQNLVANSNSKILDLVFTGEHRSLSIQEVERNEFLDKLSPHVVNA